MTFSHAFAVLFATLHVVSAAEPPIRVSLSRFTPSGGGAYTLDRNESIRYTLTNPSPFDRTISVLNTPLERKIKFDAFEFSPNVDAEYLGVVVKRMFHVSKDNVVTIPGRGEVSITIDLGGLYRFHADGSATVRARHPLVELTRSSHEETWVQSDSLSISVSGAVRRARVPTLPIKLDDLGCESDTGGTCSITACYDYRGPTVCEKKGTFSRHRCYCKPGFCAVNGVCVDLAGEESDLNTNLCDNDQREAVVRAVPDARVMIDCERRHHWNDPEGYFSSGVPSTAPNRVATVLEKADARFASSDFEIKCKTAKTVCDDEGYTFACVYPSDPDHVIHLCSQFWLASQNSQGGNVVDTQAGTLIHEMTHFSDVGGTGDFGYGNRVLPYDKAIKNADTFEYLCEKCDDVSVLSTRASRAPYSSMPLVMFSGLFAAVSAGLAVVVVRFARRKTLGSDSYGLLAA